MPGIIATIGGQRRSREEVRAWESRRIAAAARKLGVTASGPEAFVQLKLELGADEIRGRLARDIRWADRLARTQARVSPRRRRSVTELHVDRGSATEFVAWFRHATGSSDEVAMLRACPDHFLIRSGPAGQEVLETTGGSPLAARFVIDYEDLASLVTTPDPEFPHQIAGVARAADDTPIGGVRHQFRDTGAGFHARLTVEFPLPTLPTMVAGHRWHLACEFANWIEAAA
ncbi:hypothetical protein AB0H71_05565 [Nocardia sp. NPDC050697]|uniref:hypothetical protein n=1 Tax=Nocardia sp. NPDC050697 TaxID=3155158 RepID=UPI0033F4064B